MNKKLIRLTEQDLHKIVKESVNRVILLTEKAWQNPYQQYLNKNNGFYTQDNLNNDSAAYKMM
jgi:rRNA pseudouridine-1189 N-methylase Emg1 (Nep1/Mra1 family)